MAKAAVIFSRVSGAQAAVGAIYTVPASKYAIVNIMTSSTATTSVKVNGVDVLVLGTNEIGTLNGRVLPAGSTLQLTTNSGYAIASGFVYDV